VHNVERNQMAYQYDNSKSLAMDSSFGGQNAGTLGNVGDTPDTRHSQNINNPQAHQMNTLNSASVSG
jgi:hypothetical protein